MLLKDIIEKGKLVVPTGGGSCDTPTNWELELLEPFGNIKIEIDHRQLPLHLYICLDCGLAIFPSKGSIKNHHGCKKFKMGERTLIVYRNIYSKAHPG